MYAFLVPVAAFLALVFAASAIGKLRSSDRGAAAFAALQIPVRRPEAAAIGLILVEGATAVGLVTTVGWVFVGFAAVTAGLTVGMLVAVVRAHRLGATDDCGCFGEWMPSAIGPRLIARNVILTIAASGLFVSAAGVIAWTGLPLGVPRALTSPLGAVSALSGLAAAALIAAGVWSIARASAGSASEEPLPRGAGAVVVPESGEVLDLLAASTRARLLVFIKPRCHACETALAALSNAQEQLTTLVDVYVVQKAADGSVAARATHTPPVGARFALDIGGSLGKILDVGPGTPVAALIGTDGSQAGPLAIGSDEVGVLIDSILSVNDAQRS